jgi:hypothetical protein
VRPEGLGQLENPVTPSEMKPATMLAAESLINVEPSVE